MCKKGLKAYNASLHFTVFHPQLFYCITNSLLKRWYKFYLHLLSFVENIFIPCLKLL